MNVEENLERIAAANRAFNAHNFDRFFELYAENTVYHGPDFPEPVRGREVLKELTKRYAEAVPDLRTKTERIFGQDDWVCQEYTVTGTQTGPLERPDGTTIPPTNESVRTRGCGTYRFEEGKIVEEYDYRWPSPP